MMTAPALTSLRACPCCGLIQVAPESRNPARLLCARCGTLLHRPIASARSASRTAAFATSALILYPFAVTLPIMELERFGHASRASVLDGVTRMLESGHILIGIVILLCSVVLPLGKLAALLVLSGGRGVLERTHHRRLVYHLVEWTGRWGMLDVLLVAILVAAVKLGDFAAIAPGPGAIAFTITVALSLIASACFDPHALWSEEPLHAA